MTARVLLPFMVIAISAIHSCKLPSATDDPSRVTNLRFSPSAFDSFTRNTEIKYTLRSPETLSIYIIRRDSTGQTSLVNTVVENVYETKGTHAHTWLGDTRSGFFAPTGLYIGVLQIGNQRFETAVRVFHF